MNTLVSVTGMKPLAIDLFCGLGGWVENVRGAATGSATRKALV